MVESELYLCSSTDGNDLFWKPRQHYYFILFTYTNDSHASAYKESHTIKYSQKYSEIFESKCHHLIAMKLDLMLSQYLLCISILMTCEPLFYFKHIALYKLRFNVKDSNTHIFAIKSFLSSSSPVYFLPQRCSVYIIQAIMLHIYICSFYYMYCSMYCIFS